MDKKIFTILCSNSLCFFLTYYMVSHFSTDYIGVNLESQISAEVKKHLDQYGGPRTSLGSQLPDDAQGLEDYEIQQGTR